MRATTRQLPPLPLTSLAEKSLPRKMGTEPSTREAKMSSGR